MIIQKVSAFGQNPAYRSSVRFDCLSGGLTKMSGQWPPTIFGLALLVGLFPDRNAFASWIRAAF